jgi:putative phosphoesterase
MTTFESLLSPAEALAPSTSVSVRRIGLIGDDHNSEADGRDLPAEVLEAFRDTELIIHLGHMGVREQLARGVLDRLSEVAPVLAVRDVSTNSDGEQFVTPGDGTRVAGLARVIDVGGVRIGALHSLGQPPGPPIVAAPGGVPELADVVLPDVVAEKFGGRVDVVAFASTHRAVAAVGGGVLFVNPGSPTYPKGPGRVPGTRALGTVGVLDVDRGAVSFEIVELSLLTS